MSNLGIVIGQHHPVGDIVIGEPPLITIHPDGSVDGRVEDAGEAGRALVEWVRGHLAAMMRDAKAEAWDESAEAHGHLLEDADPREPEPKNPYRP
jgi:hypothetical protein